MARVTISNPIARDFAMVPNALWRADLPFAAKGCAAYLCSLRDGAMPYVREMEKALGLGRDARRKAFAALEAVGFIAWHIERDGSRIIAKTLVIDPGALDRIGNAPESQAHGAETGEKSNAPDFPADGNSGGRGTEIRPCSDGKSGDTSKQEKQERAAKAREAAKGTARPTASPANGQADGLAVIGELSPFQKSALREGKAVLIAGAMLHPSNPDHARLAGLIRSEDAERGVA